MDQESLHYVEVVVLIFLFKCLKFLIKHFLYLKLLTFFQKKYFFEKKQKMFFEYWFFRKKNRIFHFPPPYKHFSKKYINLEFTPERNIFCYFFHENKGLYLSKMAKFEHFLDTENIFNKSLKLKKCSISTVNDTFGN